MSAVKIVHPANLIWFLITAALLPAASAASDRDERPPNLTVSFDPAAEAKLSADEKELIRTISNSTYAEVRQLLSGLTNDLTLEIREGNQVIPVTGELGVALTADKIGWTVDVNREESVTEIIQLNLRTTLFHEMHHLVRGWTVEGLPPRESIMDAVIAEGMATVFARDFGGATAPWSEYPTEVESWAEELKALPNDADYSKWMFYNPDDGRVWIGYRAGVYLIDQAIADSDETAITLIRMPTKDVIQLAESNRRTD